MRYFLFDGGDAHIIKIIQSQDPPPGSWDNFNQSHISWIIVADIL